MDFKVEDKPETPCQWTWNDRKDFWATECGRGLDLLEKNVRREIDEGWEPQGGVAVIVKIVHSITDTHRSFYQAMVKDK